jgi:hypothetical protein
VEFGAVEGSISVDKKLGSVYIGIIGSFNPLLKAE